MQAGRAPGRPRGRASSSSCIRCRSPSLWGVGARTAEQLHRLGIRTVGDLAATPADTLARSVGESMAEHLGALAAGVDPRPVTPDEVEKSISSDHTVDVDLTDADDVRRELLRLSGDVARARARPRLAGAAPSASRSALPTSRTVTRVRTLPGYTDSTTTIYDTAAELYARAAARPAADPPGRGEVREPREADAVAEQLSFDDLLAAAPPAADGRGRRRRAGALRRRRDRICARSCGRPESPRTGLSARSGRRPLTPLSAHAIPRVARPQRRRYRLCV